MHNIDINQNHLPSPGIIIKVQVFPKHRIFFIKERLSEGNDGGQAGQGKCPRFFVVVNL